jgi:hypothetical protein
MTGSVVPRAPRVFLSYASEDRHWVKQFKGWFCDLLGNVLIDDFLDGNNLDFGPLHEWLNQQVDQAAVMVAFVSETYIEKDWTIIEWQRGLTQAQREKSIFVPVMMHAYGKAWWEQLRKEGKLDALPRDFQYADLTDEGRRALLADGSPAVERITNLAKRIRKELEKRAPSPTAGGVGAGEAGAPPPPPPPPRDEPEVVILGHPTNIFADDLQAESDALAKELSMQSLPPRAWPDSWFSKRAKPEIASRCTAAVAAPIVVQPVVPEEDDPFDQEKKTADRLGKLGVADARVVLWLPKGQNDPAFEEAVRLAEPDAFPAYRTDAPSGLADWVRKVLRPDAATGPCAMSLQIEAMMGLGNPSAQQLCNALDGDIREILRATLSKDSPSPQRFCCGPNFRVQLEDLGGGRAIVAVHDLNIKPSPDRRAIRKEMEDKLKFVQDTVGEVNKSQSGPRLDLFFLALLARHAEKFPYEFPPDGIFKNWNLLHFKATDQGSDPVVPYPESAAMLTDKMSRWAASGNAGG